MNSINDLSFQFQALTAINSRKKVYSTLRGAFNMDGIGGFIRDLVGGRGAVPMKQEPPEIATTDPWDGKDGEVSGWLCLDTGEASQSVSRFTYCLLCLSLAPC